MAFDVLILGGKVVDGKGGKPYKADLGIKDGRIAVIGDLSEAQAGEIIDATGLHILPGFIDTHTHSDVALLHDKQHANGIQQGVTTEILGQDGISYAPLSPENRKEFLLYNRGLNGYFENTPCDFENVEQYLACFDNESAINAAYNVPHGTVRLESVGFRDVPLTGAAMEKAKRLIRESLDQGAVGFSTGLSYYPHSFSSTKEMVELCEVAAEYDVPLVIHVRTVPRPDAELMGIAEALEIGRRSGCAVHFSHTRTSPSSAGKGPELVKPMEEAIARGQKVTVECYPYYSGAGYPLVCLPDWAVDGGFEATLRRLADPTLRKEIIKGMLENVNACDGTFSHCPHHPEFEGRPFLEVAKELGRDINDLMCDLLLEEKLDVGYYCNPYGTEEVKTQVDKDLVWLLSRPYYMIGSDAIPYGPNCHPRAFGAFPRFFRLAREHGMPVEQFAVHASALPAEVFKLKDRGTLEEGKWADVVILDKDRVTDRATYEHPRRGPEGIEYVLVNGKVAVWKGQANGILAGRGLKRGI